tara:strand:+ start:895 stop:1332 length:438 start_codon:yes stop_codon:yes gene_type:complete
MSNKIIKGQTSSYNGDTWEQLAETGMSPRMIESELARQGFYDEVKDMFVVYKNLGKGWKIDEIFEDEDEASICVDVYQEKFGLNDNSIKYEWEQLTEEEIENMRRKINETKNKQDKEWQKKVDKIASKLTGDIKWKQKKSLKDLL